MVRHYDKRVTAAVYHAKLVLKLNQHVNVF